MPEEKSFHIVIERDELDDVQTVARSTGVDLQIQPKPQVIDPFTAVLVGGGVLLVAKFVVDLMDRLRGGIVIDLRPNAKELVRRDRDVPYGWALVRAADGTVSVNVHDAPRDASERLIGQIIDGVLKSAAEVAKEATKSFGQEKVKQSLTAS
jgi:hypothetical protein